MNIEEKAKFDMPLTKSAIVCNLSFIAIMRIEHNEDCRYFE